MLRFAFAPARKFYYATSRSIYTVPIRSAKFKINININNPMVPQLGAIFNPIKKRDVFMIRYMHQFTIINELK